ncbi:hypothetical protein [Rhizobium leguminosarum]|uniref:hypothetical protein n=1 Tax=Rhizobium leguminosarum TaxID=384 RepID=UPI0010315DD6|nr:hypothetical protein [Rhizobium leguminosarum]TAX03227.1 hypothetical protein ELI07_29580 [Rhizobium leguminosarum]
MRALGFDRFTTAETEAEGTALAPEPLITAAKLVSEMRMPSAHLCSGRIRNGTAGASSTRFENMQLNAGLRPNIRAT